MLAVFSRETENPWIPLPARIALDFAHLAIRVLLRLATNWQPVLRENNVRKQVLPELATSDCTNFGHAHVERLHSTACKADTLSCFSLTPRIGRVKHNRSLTRSKFTRLVPRPGLKQSHSTASQDEKWRG
jgi:hypothetical protein